MRIFFSFNKSFFANKQFLCDKNVSIKSKLFFEAVVSSVACFAAEHRILFAAGLRRYDVEFKRLLRRVVGPPPGTDWTKPWHEIYHPHWDSARARWCWKMSASSHQRQLTSGINDRPGVITPTLGWRYISPSSAQPWSTTTHCVGCRRPPTTDNTRSTHHKSKPMHPHHQNVTYQEARRR